MDTISDKFDNQRLVRLVGYFATPFALFLGLMAVLLTPGEGVAKTVALGLLGFAAFFNLAFPKFLSEQEQGKKGWNVKFRLYLNLAVNGAVVYLLGDEFPPLWMLLALTPFATAIYGSRQRTMINALMAILLLFGIQGFRPYTGLLDYAVQACQAAFIVLISLLINGVSRLSAPAEAPASPN